MQVFFSTHFHAYTGSAGVLTASGHTVSEVLADIERQCPGLRFRVIDEQDHVRRHIKLFLNRKSIEDLGLPVGETDEIHVVGALSGG